MFNSTSKLAVVFPGQGSQSVGMLADLATSYTIISKTFTVASEVLGYDLWQLVQSGPEEKLNQTEFTQPALLTAEYALWLVWREQIQQTSATTLQSPRFLAGHSLGEYSALVCADALVFTDAVVLVRDRGRFMQSAYPPGQGGMVAVVGLEDAVLAEICKLIIGELNDPHCLVPANYNSIGQTVLAGKITAAKLAVEKAKAAGAKLAILLPVSVPSHCELMAPAAKNLSERLSQVVIYAPKIPVIHNYSVKCYTTADEIRLALINQLTGPVRWVETIKYLLQQGIEEVMECGPGKVLTGLNKRIGKAKAPNAKFTTAMEGLCLPKIK